MTHEPFLGWILLGLLAAIRLLEVLWARHNTRALLARGGRLAARDLTRPIVALHLAMYAGIVLERVLGAQVGGAWSWAAGGALVVATAGRLWVHASLGRRWTIRIVTVPGETPVRRGPYRFLRHPNYAVVLLEVIAIPVLFHAFVTLALLTIPHVLALALRIRREEAAWRRAVLETGGRP